MLKDEKILLAGPWVGEFGWELFCWQGYIRRMSKSYDKTIVIGRPNSKFLYSDFCDEYIEFNPESFKVDMWNCYGSKSYKHLVDNIKHTNYISGIFDIGVRYTPSGVKDYKNLFKEQDFIKLETQKEKFKNKKYDIIFHCRNKSTGSDRNWSYEQWFNLYNLLKDKFSIACIGNKECFFIPGTEDLRDINLEELIGVMGSSKLIIGPSSGPMHLASLAGLKHLVWSTEHNRVRYEKDWNPFKTELIFYSEGGWNPGPKKISEIIKDIFLNEN
jgi:hypothetical protein